MTTEVVIAGASTAGSTAANQLRAEGFDGRITLLGEERHPPYQRPPLSKQVLSGVMQAAAIGLPALLPDIDCHLGSTVTGLDITRRIIRVNDGHELPFDHLIIATGSRPRRFAAGLAGERTLQTIDDALALRTVMQRQPSLLIVGGGLLGMEVASTAAGFGCEATVVDVEEPLRRQMGQFLAGLLTDAAREAGVHTVVSPGGVRPYARSGVLAGVELADGGIIEADHIVTSIGAVPNVEWLQGSGLDTRAGVPVDAWCRAQPGIFAVGDVAATLDPRTGAYRRTPHWAAAAAQARVASRAVIHGEGCEPYRYAPYFWTDQFGLSVKSCGPWPAPGVPEVIEGSLGDRRALLHWPGPEGPGVAAAINFRTGVRRLALLADGVTGIGRSGAAAATR